MRDLGSILGLGRSPLEGKGYPLQYSGLENSKAPKGGKESDAAERLSLSLSYKLQFQVMVLNFSSGLVFPHILIKCCLFSLINLF